MRRYRDLDEVGDDRAVGVALSGATSRSRICARTKLKGPATWSWYRLDVLVDVLTPSIGIPGSVRSEQNIIDPSSASAFSRGAR